jgi:hypothetical protein
LDNTFKQLESRFGKINNGIIAKDGDVIRVTENMTYEQSLKLLVTYPMRGSELKDQNEKIEFVNFRK